MCISSRKAKNIENSSARRIGEAIKSLHLDAVVIFTGISEITTANLLSNYIKKHINVEKEYIHTSQSTFDDTQFYSGIWAIKMKNYVFMINIVNEGNEERSKPYQYSVNSWKNWCNKNNYELFVLTERVYPKEIMNPNWHKLFVFQLLEANGIDYKLAFYPH